MVIWWWSWSKWTVSCYAWIGRRLHAGGFPSVCIFIHLAKQSSKLLLVALCIYGTMLSLTRSRAGTLGWGLMLLSLLPGGRAFVFRAHSLNRLRMAPKQHHEVRRNQECFPIQVSKCTCVVLQPKEQVLRQRASLPSGCSLMLSRPGVYPPYTSTQPCHKRRR